MRKGLTKRQLQALSTKQKIYDSACKLFKEKGFDNVTMEEITSSINLTPGTFYLYFKTKQEILAILYAQLDTDYDDFYRNVLSSEQYQGYSALERLKIFTAYNLETCVKDGLEYTNVIYPYMIQSDSFAEAMINPQRAYNKIVTGLFTEAQEKGEVRSDISVEQLVKDLVMITRGCIVDWELHRCPGSIGDWSKSAVASYLSGVKNGQ